MIPQLVVTLTDGTKQWIDPATGPDDWEFLKLNGEDRWLMVPGRTLVVSWVSGDWPVDTRKADLMAAIKKPLGTTAWMQSIHDAVRFLLKYEPPWFQQRVTRLDGSNGGQGDWTERQPIPVLESNFANLYVAELYSDGVTPLAVGVKHDGIARVGLDRRNLHLAHLPE